ncbi:MFS transporter [Roseateles sp. BYS180W]|uniref:MFS transporter n=1 Tax=Roseateles rivi TaxID=3299028 RepID=A0ABW7FXK4_9BURK
MNWCLDRLGLPPGDLLRDRVYRHLWASILTSTLGAQVTLIALPLTAAVLLHATPTQMGLLTAMEVAPFALLSLPGGVWLDRVRKLPVYVAGEAMLAVAVASVPLAYWAGWLGMPWLYFVAFVLGSVHTVAGTAAQIVLTQVVSRERLVEAHAKNALASSSAEVAGPGLAGVLIKLLGAPVALAVDAFLLLMSTLILRGVHVQEQLRAPSGVGFWADLKAGLAFVRGHQLLVVLSLTLGAWQGFHHCAQVVQILMATRVLGLSGQEVGLSYVALGVGTVAASVVGHRVSARLGPGPCLMLGLVICGLGWSLLAMAPVSSWGVWFFVAMLFCFGLGAVFIFINFLALRQAVTPAPMLGRMTSTVRWLTVLPAGPGALLGGWLGEHLSLRASLWLAGAGALLTAAVAWWLSSLREVRELPVMQAEEPALGAEATVAFAQETPPRDADKTDGARP